jgi:hypothetical protein
VISAPPRASTMATHTQRATRALTASDSCEAPGKVPGCTWGCPNRVPDPLMFYPELSDLASAPIVWQQRPDPTGSLAGATRQALTELAGSLRDVSEESADLDAALRTALER